ncbi:MAG: hypothetical protein PHF33_08175 [Candidatus Delongbacteria bacterium]|nr:hypothetical protein [Candidatus Delongbacteria bacterium]MDD4206169.1 hypothetical protein [Candidatus Delongbacteria bacterium]
MMETVKCKKCGATIATSGYAGRSFAGTYMSCAECGSELKKASYLLRTSEVQVMLICVKCFKKIRKRSGFKCPACGEIN